MKTVAIVLFLSLFGASATAAPDTRYVSDTLSVPVRTGQSLQHKIVRMVPSGTAVEVLEERPNGYARIRTSQGDEGWVLVRFLVDKPVARSRLPKIEAQLAAQTERNSELEQELSTLRANLAETEENNKDLELGKGELTRELEAIRRTAADSLNILEQNRTLSRQLKQSQERVNALLAENSALKDHSNRDWFVAGAAIAIGSLILGLIVTRIPWRRRRRWDEL